MNAVLPLSLPEPKPGFPLPCTRPANDHAYAQAEPDHGPEELLSISFAGLTAEEAGRAMASFPGARRCRLAD